MGRIPTVIGMTTTADKLPIALRRTQYAVVVVAAIHVLALLLIFTHRDVIAASLAARHPQATATELDALTRSALLQAVLPHVVLAMLLTLRAWRLRNGRRSGRIALTVMLAIQVAAHASLPIVLAELPGYAAAVIAVQAVSLVFELAALWLLWSPEARRYVAPAPATATAASPASPQAAPAVIR
jgi:hypothetical protein